MMLKGVENASKAGLKTHGLKPFCTLQRCDAAAPAYFLQRYYLN
jgi:hypothetical protein